MGDLTDFLYRIGYYTIGDDYFTPLVNNPPMGGVVYISIRLWAEWSMTNPHKCGVWYFRSLKSKSIYLSLT